MPRRYRLAVLISHPIQYVTPLYRRLAQEPDIELTVYFCGRAGVEEYVDPGFGQRVQWDVPLLEGYNHRFLRNLRSKGSVAGFGSLVNPGIVTEILRRRPDALWVHGHSYATNLLAMTTARLCGVPILMRCETHLLLQRRGLKRLLRLPLMRLLYCHVASACLPIGTRNREFYQAHGVPIDRLFLVPYAVDNQYFAGETERWRERRRDLRAELGLPADVPVILFASKLMPRKRPLDLIRAYQRLRCRGGEAALVIVGSGEQEDEVRRYVEERGVPDVVFCGFRNQSELARFYALADIFALPSENEPWGLIINEAMAAGLPVIAAEEIGAVPDLVRHGETGLLHEAGDVETLALHLETLAADAELRARMAQRGREVIADWDYDRCVAGIRAALRGVAA